MSQRFWGVQAKAYTVTVLAGTTEKTFVIDIHENRGFRGQVRDLKRELADLTGAHAGQSKRTYMLVAFTYLP